MFYGRMTDYALERPVTTTDATNYSHTSWEDAGTARIYVIKKDANTYRTNELNLTESQWVGYTQDTEIEEGWRVGGKMVVDYVADTRTGRALSLSAVGKPHGGR